MFTKKLEDQFSADLLNTVRGVLDEAKKCPEDCECEKCEKEDEMKKEGYVSHAQRKAVWASRADDGEGHPDKKKKVKKEGYMPAADEPSAKDKKTAQKIRDMMAKEKKPVNEEDDGWYTHSQMYGSKKSEKHPKGISADEWKSGIRWHHGKNKRINIKEEADQLDEISKATMGRYINKAKDSIDIVSYRQGHKEAHGSSAAGAEKKLTKRHKGIETAVKKLTKEEQDFIDALNTDTLEEGRGRPPKEGSAAWKARQGKADDDMVALGMQLRKAHSINKKVRFMDGKEHDIHPNHITRFNDHMGARRTTQEKDNFQRQAHKSHADFVKAVSAPVPKDAKDTGEIVKYR
jgi:hypothetical protein